MLVSEYFASFSLKIDKASFAKVDKELNSLEARIKGLGNSSGKGFRLSNFFVRQEKLDAVLLKGLEIASAKLTFNISKFDVNQAAMNLALGTALDIASTRNTFQISRFHIDQTHLNTALIAAMKEATLLASKSSTLRPNAHVNPTGGGANEGGIRPRHAAVAGGIAGGVARLYAPALALGLGGYGLSQLNQRNQQVVSAQLQSTAVVQQAGGSAAQGADSFQYLRSEANRIGFNYLDASGDYNKLISGLTGSGVGLKDSQKVFSGFAELARVNKLDKTTQNRLFRALSQVAGKGKLQAEELTGQIAEALPGGTALFARAYQAQLKETGRGKGDLTGQAAIAQLQADMKKGLVTSDILKYAGRVASKDAESGLPAAQTASQAEQQRYQNAVTDLAVVASDAGVEEGFARIFRTLNAGLSESNGLVRILSEGFNDATKWADDLLLFPQDFIRALDGRDSLVADWLGKDATTQLQKDWKSIQESLTTISSLGAPSWLPTLETVSKDIAAQFKIIAALSNGDFSGLGEGLKNLAVGRYKSYGDAVLSGPNLALRAAGELFDTPTPQLSTDGLSYYAPKSTLDTFGLTKQLSDINPLTGEALPKYDIFSTKPIGPQYDSNVFGQKLASLEDLTAEERYNARNSTRVLGDFPLQLPTLELPNLETTPSGAPFQDLSRPPNQTPSDIASQSREAAMAQAEASITNNNINNQFDVSINVDATLAGIEVQAQAEAMANAFSTALTGAFEQAQVNYPTK